MKVQSYLIIISTIVNIGSSAVTFNVSRWKVKCCEAEGHTLTGITFDDPITLHESVWELTGMAWEFEGTDGSGGDTHAPCKGKHFRFTP